MEYRKKKIFFLKLRQKISLGVKREVAGEKMETEEAEAQTQEKIKRIINDLISENKFDAAQISNHQEFQKLIGICRNNEKVTMNQWKLIAVLWLSITCEL